MKKSNDLYHRQLQYRLVTTTCSSLATIVNNNTSWKDRFNTKILLTKNNLSNNLLFTSERYNETIELINNAKLKR